MSQMISYSIRIAAPIANKGRISADCLAYLLSAVQQTISASTTQIYKLIFRRQSFLLDPDCKVQPEGPFKRLAMVDGQGKLMFFLRARMEFAFRAAQERKIDFNKIDILTILIERVVITDAAAAIRSQAFAKLKDPSYAVAKMALRCCKLAYWSGCWVDAVGHLGLAHPELERSCLAFSQLSQADVTRVATNPALQDILRIFLHSGVDVSEATLRMTLWDRLLVHLLDSSKPDVLALRSEFSLVEKLELVDKGIADIAVLCNKKQSVVLLVKASREKVLPGFQHKDFSKMAAAMIQLCLANCKGFCSMGKDICRVRVFGIWVGGSQARFCMVHPKIHVDGTGQKQISIMLSAPDCWTFDLLGPQSGPPCQGPCCTTEGIHKIAGWGQWITTPVPFVLPDIVQLPTIPESIGPNDQNYSMRDINFFSVAAVKYFCDQVKKYSAAVNGMDDEPPNTPDQTIVGALWPKAVAIVPPASATQKDVTPQKPHPSTRALNLPADPAEVAAKVLSVGGRTNILDCFGKMHFVIRKPYRAGRELMVMSKMGGNFLAPRLLGYRVGEDMKSCILHFEFLESIDSQFIGLHDFIQRDEERNLFWLILEAAACAIHTLCGLYILHDRLGLVHSDISEHSIMYSREESLWKLVGYGHACSLQESLSTPRVAGNEEMRAPEVQSPGIFTPAADVYSLGMALYKIWFYLLNHAIDDGVGEKGAEDLFETFKSMILRMKARDPLQRPSVKEALRFFYSTYIDRVQDYPDFKFKAKDRIFELVREIFLFENIRHTCMSGPVEELAKIRITDVEEKECLYPELMAPTIQ